MDNIKIGFLGAGFMGQLAHLQNYVITPGCEVVCISDAKTGQAKKVAAAYGVQKVCGIDEMLADKSIDAIVASQQFNNHVNIVPMVLNAGKHLFTEKPLCIFEENARSLADLAKEKNLIHMVGYHKRSDPAVEYAMNVIRGWKTSGEVGKMKYIRISMPPGDWVGGSRAAINTDEPYPPYNAEKKPDGMSDRLFDDYVTFVNYYIHQVNLMRFLFGSDYKLSFADRTGVMLAVESSDGVSGAIEMAAYQTSDDWQENATVFFERGYIKIDLPAPLAHQTAGRVTVFTDNGGGMFCEPRLKNVHAMKNQALNFVRAVKGEIKPPCDSAEAVLDLKFAMDYVKTLNG